MGVSLDTLQVESVRRVISYSDDPAVLMNGISNLLAIEDRQLLYRLARDHQFCRSLFQLCRTSSMETPLLQGPDRTELSMATAVTWRCRAAIAHVASCHDYGYASPLIGSIPSSFGIDDEPGLDIPSDLIKASSPVLIDRYLGYVALILHVDPRVRPMFFQTVTTEFERLIASSWSRISIITACMRSICKFGPDLDVPVHDTIGG